MHSGSPWGSLGSSGAVTFIRVRPVTTLVGFTQVLPVGRWIHPGWLRSLGIAMGVVVLIRGRYFHSGSPGGRWVHSRSLG